MTGPTIKVDPQAVQESNIKTTKQGSLSAFQRKLQKEQALHQAQLKHAAGEKAEGIAELKEKAKLSNDYFTLDSNTCASAVCTIYAENAAATANAESNVGSEEILRILSDKAAVEAIITEHTERFLDKYKMINEGDQKRDRRLARNRQSARLRRLKKKQLIDGLELEITQLQAALKRLLAHRWGTGGRMKILMALGKERQDIAVGRKAREVRMSEVLDMQEQDMIMLQDDVMQSLFLSWVAGCELEGLYNQTDADADADGNAVMEDSQMSGLLQMRASLANALRLTPEQQQRMQQLAAGPLSAANMNKNSPTKDNKSLLASAVRTMRIKRLFSNLKNDPKQAFRFNALDDVQNMIQKVLEPDQVKKFWKWTDKNRKSINLMKYAKEKQTRRESNKVKGRSPAQAPQSAQSLVKNMNRVSTATPAALSDRASTSGAQSAGIKIKKEFAKAKFDASDLIDAAKAHARSRCNSRGGVVTVEVAKGKMKNVKASQSGKPVFYFGVNDSK